MSNYSKQMLKPCRRNSPTGRVTRLGVTVLSVLQVYWVPVIWAAGTVSAAAAFGDKSYMSSLCQQAQEMTNQQKPRAAVTFLEGTLAKYGKWRKANPQDAKLSEKVLPEMYLQLARSKAAAGMPKQDVVSAYKRVVKVSSLQASKATCSALVKLSEHVPLAEYKGILQSCMQANNNRFISWSSSFIAKKFLEKRNWAVCERYLDAVFSVADNVTTVAQDVGQVFATNKLWQDKFDVYTRRQPQLTAYVFQKDMNKAAALVVESHFDKATEVYRDLAKRCGPQQDKAMLELKVYECLYKAGRYDNLLGEIDRFIAAKKAARRDLAREAMLLKGQCHIQLGQVDKAYNVFLTLTIEYPESKTAPNAAFYVGYCNMLQGRFQQAKEAFGLLVKEHPDSTYANKAQLCLQRIEQMTK